jgi:hypothetical protein
MGGHLLETGRPASGFPGAPSIWRRPKPRGSERGNGLTSDELDQARLSRHESTAVEVEAAQIVLKIDV